MTLRCFWQYKLKSRIFDEMIDIWITFLIKINYLSFFILYWKMFFSAFFYEAPLLNDGIGNDFSIPPVHDGVPPDLPGCGKNFPPPLKLILCEIYHLIYSFSLQSHTIRQKNKQGISKVACLSSYHPSLHFFFFFNLKIYFK